MVQHLEDHGTFICIFYVRQMAWSQDKVTQWAMSYILIFCQGICNRCYLLLFSHQLIFGDCLMGCMFETFVSIKYHNSTNIVVFTAHILFNHTNVTILVPPLAMIAHLFMSLTYQILKSVYSCINRLTLLMFVRLELIQDTLMSHNYFGIYCKLFLCSKLLHAINVWDISWWFVSLGLA